MQPSPSKATKRKKILFVDDDAIFLDIIQSMFSEMAKGSWEISTAHNHAQALEILRQNRVDLVVLDFTMPVMDGKQFLKLLARTYPGQEVAILSGEADEAHRKACEENGAALVLQKPVAKEGFAALFSALDAMAGTSSQEGFYGVMRCMGIQELLQMECLGLKSSILEIFSTGVQGRIFMCEGAIVHAEAGALDGEMALYGLLGLRGGKFNFTEYTEPSHRTIEGAWEHLLMEAARLSDEGLTILEMNQQETAFIPKAATDASVQKDIDAHMEEILLCSGSGNVLYEWGCKKVDGRLKLLQQVEEQARQVSDSMKVGLFDRLEIITPRGRIVCQTQPQRRVFVRSTRGKTQSL